MPYVQQGIIVGLVLLVTGMAWAGGSNYGITPGSRPQVEGKISEWQVPTPKFARDPAPGPDGNIYISVMHGNKIARFDTHTQTFHEWDLPAGAQPHGLLVDRNGQVWYTGNGNGTIGHLDPATPAQAINRVPNLGTLQVGAPADLSMVEIVEGPIDFVDTRQNTRKGERWIKPVQTVKAGRPFGRPYPTPFGWP